MQPHIAPLPLTQALTILPPLHPRHYNTRQTQHNTFFFYLNCYASQNRSVYAPNPCTTPLIQPQARPPLSAPTSPAVTHISLAITQAPLNLARPVHSQHLYSATSTPTSFCSHLTSCHTHFSSCHTHFSSYHSSTVKFGQTRTLSTYMTLYIYGNFPARMTGHTPHTGWPEPYMVVYLMNYPHTIPYIHHTHMVLANPTHTP
jgi:hypothetical protein